ncbi:MAG: hexitol phosphatase HxpB [Chitinophagales bacterium]|nr:hexitol phosphatase HxpB [Chitinophagales bacterium]MDW8273979.1 hexitol phosphatase HxpB [Chitinophagales bacterium]
MEIDCQAVIFDMDGLLVDSEPYWRKAEIEVFKTVGLFLTEEDCMKTTGFRFDEVVEYWFHQKPWIMKSVAQVEEEVLKLMENYIKNHSPLMDGADEAIATASNLSKKVAIASSSPLRLIHCVAERLGGIKRFDALVSAEFEPYGKPHPGVYLAAARQLGLRPEKCVAVEDSLNGVIAAKAARMYCVAIPAPHDRSNQKFFLADQIFYSLSEFTAWLRNMPD